MWLLDSAITIVPDGVDARVTYTGLSDDLEKNARALMAIASASCDAADWRVERLYRDADVQLRNAMEALGSYRYKLTDSFFIEIGAGESQSMDILYTVEKE